MSTFAPIGQKVEKATKVANGVEEDDRVVEEIESLCMNCHENVIRYKMQTCSDAQLLRHHMATVTNAVWPGHNTTTPHQDPLLP